MILTADEKATTPSPLDSPTPTPSTTSTTKADDPSPAPPNPKQETPSTAAHSPANGHANDKAGNAADDNLEEAGAVSGKRGGVFSRKRLLGPVDNERGDLALLAHSFATGLTDAGSYANWSVFVGMQTGNTVILGLSTAGLPDNPHGWLTTLVSISSFLIGAFLTFRATRLILPTNAPLHSSRLWLSTLYAFQSLLLFIAAACVAANLVPHDLAGGVPRSAAGVVDHIKIVALIPPLAFQSGMQIAVSRLLGFNELPVNVLTSTYADFVGDPKLFALHNVKRNRRGVAVLLLLAGAICSGWLMQSWGGLQSVFWTGAGVKLCVAVGTLFVQAEGKVKAKA